MVMRYKLLILECIDQCSNYIRKTLCLLFVLFMLFLPMASKKSKLLKSTAYLAKAIPYTFHMLFKNNFFVIIEVVHFS